ncbi:MAG: hypothetical protein AABX51_01760 [Nanoarchaeota archaeon]
MVQNLPGIEELVVGIAKELSVAHSPIDIYRQDYVSYGENPEVPHTTYSLCGKAKALNFSITGPLAKATILQLEVFPDNGSGLLVATFSRTMFAHLVDQQIKDYATTNNLAYSLRNAEDGVLKHVTTVYFNERYPSQFR